MKRKIIASFKLPLKGKRNLFDILIGGILMFFPIVNFVSIGFLGEKLRRNLELEKTRVKWDENIEFLFIMGAKIFLISAVYLFIPVIFMCLGGLFITSFSNGKIWSLFFLRGQILNTVGTILLLISLYLLFPAICIFLEENSLKKGFNLREVVERILLIPKDYTVIYMVITGILTISAIIIFLLLNWITGLLISGFLCFYDGLVITNILSKFFPRKSVKIHLPF